MVLMIADTTDHIRLAIQRESVRRIKGHRADAKWRLRAIDNFASRLNRRDELVKVWRFGRPERR